MSDEIQLPELPEPDGEIEVAMAGWLVPFDVYRPSTVQAYARAAVLADRERRAQPAPGAWIPVSERLPEEKQAVLLIGVGVGHRGEYTTDQYAGWRDRYGWARWPHEFAPTHWQPQPQPPKGEK